ncbi:hypothetical protein K1T71_002028 [Dendrolimus kikuchii]|uniref:Uncharacterized protein n=1 Tax=Dendrolimus kikuchii TaxID=765133 RepID=A0ACC1DFA5_9NEOP|nr:hypothetical protein K1T71_002028 [Dendrolimus kikuchii]
MSSKSYTYSLSDSYLIEVMEEESDCQLRRRRLSGNPKIPSELEVSFQVDEGGPDLGTPSPNRFKTKRSLSDALIEFKNKQQSFDIQVEECEEEEIIIDSEDEDQDQSEATGIDRAVTPTPIQDFAANVIYTEGPQSSNFLKVRGSDPECYTDVSDADTEEEE